MAIEQPIVVMKLVLQFGLFLLARYKYWIDGHYWEDQKNVHSIAAGRGKGITYISGITPYYPPLTLNWNIEKIKVVDTLPKKKGWYNVGIGVNNEAKRNEKGVIIK